MQKSSSIAYDHRQLKKLSLFSIKKYPKRRGLHETNKKYISFIQRHIKA